MAENLEKEVYELKQKVELLERKIDYLAMINNVIPNNNQEALPTYHSVETKQNPPDAQPMAQPQMQSASPVQSTQPAPQKNVQQKKPAIQKNVENIEKTIGTKIMGVLASVLVFLALVIFGSLVYDKINDVMKSAIMLLISGAFTVFGILKMKKESKYKPLFVSLAGCGVGAFYITFLIMKFVFHIFDDTALVAVLSIWIICVALLSKYKSVVFAYICYAGLAVSTILCSLEWNSSLISLIFYLVGILVLMVLHLSKDYRKNIFWYVQIPVFLLILSFTYSEFYQLSAVSLILMAVLIAQLWLYKMDKENEIPLIVNLSSYLTVFIINLIRLICIYDDEQIALSMEGIYAIYCILLIVLCINLYLRIKDNPIYYLILYFTAFSLCFNFNLGFYNDYIGVAIFMIPCLIYGLYKNNIHYKIIGCGYLALYTFMFSYDMNDTVTLVVSVLTMAGLILYLFRKKNDYLIKYFMTFYIFFFFVFVCDNYDFYDEIIAFLILATFSLLINGNWYRNEENGNIAGIVISYVINSFMMILGLYLIGEDFHDLFFIRTLPGTETLSLVLVCLMTLALFFRNSGRLFKTKIPEILVGIYICLKFSIYIFVILVRLEAVSYVVSIFGILFAILCVVYGFRKLHKSCRMYGLALSMICVFKLILFDFKYESSLSYAVGFLISGLLCFAISWIYSYISKQEQMKELKQGE